MARHFNKMVLWLNLDIYVDMWVHAARSSTYARLVVQLFRRAKSFQKFLSAPYKSPRCRWSLGKALRPSERSWRWRGATDGQDWWRSSTLTHNHDATAVQQGTANQGPSIPTNTSSNEESASRLNNMCIRFHLKCRAPGLSSTTYLRKEEI